MDGRYALSRYLPGSSRNSSMQPLPQNAYSVPSWARVRPFSRACAGSTVIPQTGSSVGAIVRCSLMTCYLLCVGDFAVADANGSSSVCGSLWVDRLEPPGRRKVDGGPGRGEPAETEGVGHDCHRGQGHRRSGEDRVEE